MEWIKNFWTKSKKFATDKIIVPFRKNINQPAFLGMSVAVGTFCTLLPIFVLQQYLCILLWIIFKRFGSLHFSLIIALALTVVTNPATMPFFLYAYYLVGIVFTGDKAVELAPFLERIKSIMDVGNQSIFKAVENGFGFVFDEVGAPVLVGCAVCVLVLTPASYFITYAIAKYVNGKSAVKKI